MKRTFFISCFLLFASSCQSCDEDCYYNYYANLTNYKVKSNTETPILSTPVMTNGFNVDLQKIDEIILYVENCLEMELKLGCLEAVIPPDWYVSYCVNKEGEELFPCRVDPRVCTDKGLPIDPDCAPGQLPDEDCPYPDCVSSEVPDGHCPCPCNCRATIQDENVIITTPNLKLFSAELIRMMTGVNNIWLDPELTKCYMDPAADNITYLDGANYCDGTNYCQ